MVITDKVLKTCAKNIVKTCNLSKGDAVIVRGGTHALRILEEIVFECYRSGAIPCLVVESDKLTQRVFEHVPTSTLATVPKHMVGLVKECDMLISVEEFDDPSIAAGFPRDKMQARRKAMMPILDLISNPATGKKWLYAGWPTKAAARSYGIPYSDLEKLVIGGMSVPPEALMATGKRIGRKLQNAEWAHVWNDKGTEFRVKVRDRRVNIDDGVISRSDIAIGDKGANLPAGEVFVAPHENAGSGSFFCPVTRDHHSFKLLKDVYFEFEKGRIMLDTVTARNDADLVVKTFKESERLDKGKFDPVRTLNIAELGIGFNPKIWKSIGYVLTDEKVVGTVHVAFGLNSEYGGTSQSVLHWDFVSAPGMNIEIERSDGKEVQVMSKGKFV
jgi:aminopeptidase